MIELLYDQLVDTNTDVDAIQIHKYIVKTCHLVVAYKCEMQFTTPQGIALLNPPRGVTNALQQPKQGIETLLLLIKEWQIIPSSIHSKVKALEREGVTHFILNTMNYDTAQINYKQGVCTGCYYNLPADLLSNMIRYMFLKNMFVTSQTQSIAD